MRSMIGGVATAAAVRSWPFRVFSFPTEVIPARIIHYRFLTYFDIRQMPPVDFYMHPEQMKVYDSLLADLPLV